MKTQNVRFSLLMAAAIVLPSTGYLLGFTKAQAPMEDDWSEEIKVDLDKLSPVLPGIAGVRYAAELKLAEAEKESILKIIREDAPGLIEAQKQEWGQDMSISRRVFSGDEIIGEFRGVFTLRNEEAKLSQKGTTGHYLRISAALPPAKYKALRLKTQAALEASRRERLFIILDPANAEELRLSVRQRKQFVRLASYFVHLKKANKFGDDAPFPTLPIAEALEELRNSASPGQFVQFSYQAEDYLDPIQQMQLRAMVYEKTYVPVP